MLQRKDAISREWRAYQCGVVISWLLHLGCIRSGGESLESLPSSMTELFAKMFECPQAVTPRTQTVGKLHQPLQGHWHVFTHAASRPESDCVTARGARPALSASAQRVCMVDAVFQYILFPDSSLGTLNICLMGYWLPSTRHFWVSTRRIDRNVLCLSEIGQ